MVDDANGETGPRIPSEHELPSGESGVRVAVIDSGWDRTIANDGVLQGVGLVDPDNDFAPLESFDDHDRIGHGTACSDLIMRFAPAARIIPIRVFGDSLETSVPVLVEAIRWAVEHRVGVVNISLGTIRSNALRPLYSICEYARIQGTVIIAAGHATLKWSFPAIFDNAIGVGSEDIDQAEGYAYYPDSAIECRARGNHPGTLGLGGNTIDAQGTSFAAPVVTAAVARLLEGNPGADLEQVRRLLQAGSLAVR